MNEMKKKLQISILLTALMAGSMTFAPEGEEAPRSSSGGDHSRETRFERMQRHAREFFNPKSKAPSDETDWEKFEQRSQNIFDSKDRNAALTALELEPNKEYTAQEITAAYRKMALKYHPDKNANSEIATEKFKEIKSAFDYLKNLSPEKNSGSVPASKAPTPEEPSFVSSAVKSVSDSFSSMFKTFSKTTDNISDYFNGRRDAETASQLAARKAIIKELSTDEKASFDRSFARLKTTAQRQTVADAWMKARLNKINILQENIENINIRPDLTKKQIPALRVRLEAELQKAKAEFDLDRDVFVRELQGTVKPNEAVIMIDEKVGGTFKRRIDIVDMSKIDPTQSIESQTGTLTSTGFLGLGDPVTRTQADVLTKAYGEWVAKQIKFTSDKSIISQLESEVERITGHPLSAIDTSIQEAIFTPEIKELLRKEAADKNSKNYEQWTKEATALNARLKAIAKEGASTKTLGMTPAAIAALPESDIKALTSDTIQKLSPAQFEAFTLTQLADLKPDVIESLSASKIKALTPEQLKALTPEQTKSLDVSYLSDKQVHSLKVNFLESRQLLIVLDKLSPDQIGDLTANQTRSLTIDQLKTLTSEQIKGMKSRQIKSLESEQIKALTDEQIKALTPQQLLDMTKDQLKQLTLKQKRSITTDQTTLLSRDQLSIVENLRKGKA